MIRPIIYILSDATIARPQAENDMHINLLSPIHGTCTRNLSQVLYQAPTTKRILHNLSRGPAKSDYYQKQAKQTK